MSSLLRLRSQFEAAALWYQTVRCSMVRESFVPGGCPLNVAVGTGDPSDSLRPFIKHRADGVRSIKTLITRDNECTTCWFIHTRLGDAGPLLSWIKVADGTVEKSSVINVGGTSQHEVDQPFDNDRITILPMVDILFVGSRFVRAAHFETPKCLGIVGLEDLDRIVWVSSPDETHPRSLIARISFLLRVAKIIPR